MAAIATPKSSVTDPGAQGRPPAPSIPPSRQSSPVLIGRGAELDHLRAVMTSPPAVALIEGEAGVGKTRLIEELLDLPGLAERCQLVGHCQPLREPFPLGPVVDALRSGASSLPRRLGVTPVAGALVPLLPELRDRLPQLPEPTGDPQAERHRVFRALIDVLESLPPTVMVLEDLHWADDNTREFLGFLSARLPTHISLVISYRKEELANSALESFARLPHHVSAARVELVPLNPDGVGELVAAILATDGISSEFTSRLHEKTEGLPFAVEEVVALLREREDIVKRESGWERRLLHNIGVPSAIRDLVLARLERLSEDARRIVQVASSVEKPADEQLIAQAAGLSARRTAAALTEVLGALLMEDGDRYRFRHSLASQAVYESIAPPERRRMHARVATALEARGNASAATLAHHYRGAGRVEKWVHYAEAAADIASSFHDDSGACHYLLQALGVPKISITARTRLALKLGKAALYGLMHKQAIAVLEEIIVDDALPKNSRGRIRCLLGSLLHQAGDASGARREWEAALPDLRRDAEFSTKAMRCLAHPWVVEGSLDEHLSWLDKALSLSSQISDSAFRTALCVQRAELLLDCGDSRAWDWIAAFPKETGSMVERREMVRAWLNFAQGAVHLGHYGRAGKFLDRAAALSEAMDYERLVDAIEATSLLLADATGSWEGLGERARDLARRTEERPHVHVDAALVLGSVLVKGGDKEEGASVLRGIVDVATRAGSIPISILARSHLAWMELGRGQLEASLVNAALGLSLVESKGIWVWATPLVPVMVNALLRCGAVRDAEGHVTRFEHGTGDRDSPAASAALCWTRGLLAGAAGDEREAEKLLDEAHRRLSGLPDPYNAARLSEERGMNAPDEAHLLRSLETYERLGATWDAARIRREIRRRGKSLPVPWRGGRRGYGSRLSPREREVTALAARGRTNREIAEELCLSIRTVEGHVASALGKLNLTNRRQLARFDHVSQ